MLPTQNMRTARADDRKGLITFRVTGEWAESRINVLNFTSHQESVPGKPNDRQEPKPRQTCRVTFQSAMLQSAGESWCRGTSGEPRTLIWPVHLPVQAAPQWADEHPDAPHEGQRWIGWARAERRRSGLLSTRGAGVALVVLAVGLFVWGSLAGCRTTRERPQAQPGGEARPARETPPESPFVSAADGYLATETGHMAVEDQKRAREAYRSRRRTVPHRDYPIRPVLPP